MYGTQEEDDDRIVGYDEPQPGILTLQMTSGPGLTVRDEDGTMRQRLDEIVSLNNSGTPRPGGLPDQTGAPASPDQIGRLQSAMAGAPMGGQIPQEQPMATPEPPPGLLPAGYSHRAVNPQSVAQIEQEGRTFDAAQDEAALSQFDADTAKNRATAESYDMQAKQAQADAIAAQDRIDRYQDSLKKHMAEQDAARLRPVDGAKAFGGPRGWFSAIAALAVDRSNMYAALAGMPTKPNTVIEDLIAESTRQQENQKKLDMGAAGALVGADKAEIEANELQMREAVKRQMVAQIGKMQQGPMQAQAQANLDKFEASTQELALKRAQGLAATDTTQFAPPKPPPVVQGNKYAESEGATRLKLEGLKQWSEQSGIKIADAHKKYEKYGQFRRAGAEMRESERQMLHLLKGTDKTGDVAGLGYLDDLTPDWLVSEEGQAMRQTFGHMLDSYARVKTGAAISKDEMELFKAVVKGGQGTPADIRRGVGIMMQAIRSQSKEYEADSPGIVKLYGQVADYNHTQSVGDIRKNAIRKQPEKAKATKAPTSAQQKLQAEREARDAEREKATAERMKAGRSKANERVRFSGGRY
jgi:hypothetical protein